MNRRATRRQSRKSRQGRKPRKSRKHQGGFVRGTSPILNAGVFGGTGVWGKSVTPTPVMGYKPFATTTSTYRPFASQPALRR